MNRQWDICWLELTPKLVRVIRRILCRDLTLCHAVYILLLLLFERERYTYLCSTPQIVAARNISIHTRPHIFRAFNRAIVPERPLSRAPSMIIRKFPFVLSYFLRSSSRVNDCRLVIANSFSMSAGNRFVRYRSFFSLVSSRSLPFFSLPSLPFGGGEDTSIRMQFCSFIVFRHYIVHVKRTRFNNNYRPGLSTAIFCRTGLSVPQRAISLDRNGDA